MAVSTRHLHRKHIRNQRQRESAAAARDGFRGEQHHTDASKDDISEERSAKIAKFLFNGDNGQDDMPSMRDSDALWLALCLQPMNIRNELIIQLFEAIAIFAALFLNGVWILYEWGNAKGGYGGDGTNAIADRIFDFIVSIALVMCIDLALNSAVAWMISILYSSSNDDFVYNSRKSLRYMYGLLNCIVQLVAVGICLGIYSNLSPYWPETIVAIIIAVGLYISGFLQTRQLVLHCMSLEYYHLPRWMKIGTPVMWTYPKQKAKVKLNAKARAERLKAGAYSRAVHRNSIQSGTIDKNSSTSLRILLESASTNIDMGDYDVSNFETRLKEDWFFETKHLEGMSVDLLSRYMPFRLAQEVHRQLSENSNTTDGADNDQFRRSSM